MKPNYWLKTLVDDLMVLFEREFSPKYMVFIFNRIFWILNDLPGCSYKVTLPSKRPGREAFLMHMEQQRRMKLGPEAPPMEEGGAGQLYKHQTPEV